MIWDRALGVKVRTPGGAAWLHRALTAAFDMLHDLAAQDSSTQLARRLRRYTAPAVLGVDEVGYPAYNALCRPAVRGDHAPISVAPSTGAYDQQNRPRMEPGLPQRHGCGRARR